MRKNLLTVVILYSFFLLAGRVYGIGEKTLTIGSASSWDVMEKRQGVTEASLIRPYPVLVLAGGETASDLRGGDENSSVDLYLSFDEGRAERFADSVGRYDVSASPELSAASVPWSRIGSGAALFSGGAPLVLKPRRTALFASGAHIRDFSIEFWLYPQNTDNGGQILSWNSSKPDGQGGYVYQTIQCNISKNRLQWTFDNFFSSPDGGNYKSITLTGPPALPRTWSNHLIRFDADLGLLEYLVDGRVEALDYTTPSGHEGGDVYTPVIGGDPRLALGSRFSGMMDEFRVYRNYLERPVLTRYPSKGGRVESRTLDLGNTNSRVLKIEAFGGRTSSTAGKVRNEYAGNGDLNFKDYSGIRFSIRTSNEPYRWNDIPWIPVKPGAELPDSPRGRYIQIAADIYPGEDGETSPYLSELRVVYSAAEPPLPPIQVIAEAKDGAVELSWKASPSRETGGYLVYYGTARGEYFGDNAILTNNNGRLPPLESPIDVGNRTTVRIDGLNNGTLYFFAVAAYSRPGITGESPDGGVLEPGRQVIEPGEFSREAAARPLRMAE